MIASRIEQSTQFFFIFETLLLIIIIQRQKKKKFGYYFTNVKCTAKIIIENLVKSTSLEKSRENEVKTFNDLGGNGLGRPFGWHRGGGQ